MRVLRLLLLCSCVLLMAFVAKEKRKPIIYMIGDSTMANKSLKKENPERGWGQVLPGYLSTDIIVDNHAQNGRSSKSFIDEGRWQIVIDKVQEGDYVFIQFGHNDEKPKPDRHTDPNTTFRDNLRRFINETRAKGGIPVLFTSVARRHFSGDTLLETHGEYIPATRIVAKEENVPLIDMNASTTELLKKTGDEGSRKWFMWVTPGTSPLYPDGKEDNTHFNIQGARLMARLAVEEISEKVPALAPYIRYYDFVVAKDGSGDFFTIQDAIDAIPMFRTKETKIYIRKGVYKERVLLPRDKNNVTFIGEDLEETVLTGDSYAGMSNCFGENMGTSGSAVFYVYGSNFTAENMTFENSAGRVGQAVAVLTMGDKIVFRNCRFLGNQDTLYTKGEGTRTYFESCYIEGTVDFIFGKATAVFYDCVIHSKSDNYITAAATPETQIYGYLFYHCKLTAEAGVKSYLGRPWRPFAQVAYVECEMGDHIRPEGWDPWGKESNKSTAQYVEINNTGKGADVSKRVDWMRKPSKKMVYTPEAFLKGDDNFNPIMIKK